jgi:hypothetical protein
MRSLRKPWLVVPAHILAGILGVVGCQQTPIDHSTYEQGPAPLRMPAPEQEVDCSSGRYEDSLTGGKVFSMYCAYCHSAPTLAERPYASYQNAAAHMRDRANLTGKEYAKLMEFLRRYHDVPAPEDRAEPGPKQFIFSQPISELREGQPKTLPDPSAGPRAGATNEGSPGQPPPGSSPREAR